MIPYNTIGAFVAILSLNLTASLVQDYGVIARTLPITAATTTTPIVVTSPAHGFPLASRVHGIVTNVGGMPEADGLWVLTPLGPDTFSLATYDAGGSDVDSVGAGTYTSGGQIQYAFPDGQILLGRRNKMTATMVTSPRVVMIPTRGAAWILEPYGGASYNVGPAHVPNQRGTAERQAMRAGPTLGTQNLTFEVYVNGTGPNYGEPLAPDFSDFDATQFLSHALVAQLFDMMGTLSVLRESWPSQEEAQGAMTQRGQQWMGVIEIQMPVRKPLIPFAPVGVTGTIVVEPVDPLVPDDQTTITIPT